MYFQLEITRMAVRAVSRALNYFGLKSMILCLVLICLELRSLFQFLVLIFLILSDFFKLHCQNYWCSFLLHQFCTNLVLYINTMGWRRSMFRRSLGVPVLVHYMYCTSTWCSYSYDRYRKIRELRAQNR